MEASPPLNSAWTTSVERGASGKPSAKKQLNVVNSGMCKSSLASKMNLAFIPSKPVALFLCSFFNARRSLVNVISVFTVWLGGGSVTWAKWSIHNHMGGGGWPTNPWKPCKSATTLILSTIGDLGRYFFQNESASTLASAHICWTLAISQKNLFLSNNFLSLLSWCLAMCKSGFSFQPKLQLTFRYMTVGVKPRFMAVSFSAAPSQKLTNKSRLC